MEKFDVYDAQDRPTGRVAEKGEALGDHEYRRIAEFWLRTPEGEYLIQQRSANKKQFPRMWVWAASGSVQAGETPVQTCIREAEEELGLALDPADAEFYGTITEDGIHFHIYLFQQSVDLAALRLEPMEVADAALVSEETIFTMIKEKRFINLPYYPAFFAWANERRSSSQPSLRD